MNLWAEFHWVLMPHIAQDFVLDELVDSLEILCFQLEPLTQHHQIPQNVLRSKYLGVFKGQLAL